MKKLIITIVLFLAITVCAQVGGLYDFGDIWRSITATDDKTTIQNNTDSTTGFQVLDTDGGTPILNVDTTNERVGIGIASPLGLLHLNGGMLILDVVTIATDDTTPDVSGGNIFVTSSNNGGTAISDLDNPQVGQIVYIIGGSNSNSSTIGDSGNFALSASWTASLDDVLVLLVQADNDYIELSRTDN